MCGRFTSLTPPEELATMFDAEIVDDVRKEDFHENYNVAPSTNILVVASTPAHGRRIGRLRWGLVPEWSRNAVGTGHVNARSETVAEKPSFRDSFSKRRCIIPMSGYYEWRTVGLDSVTPRGPKRAVYIIRRDGEPLAVAGLWSKWTDTTGVGGADPAISLKTCCVVTREADDMLATVHDRMPVILDREDWPLWLGEEDSTPDSLEKIFDVNSRRTDLEMVDVGSRVNSVRNNGPDLILPRA